MKEVFRLQTDFSSSFDRWVSSFVSGSPSTIRMDNFKGINP